MKILAFDQATNITAWCVWNSKRPVKYDMIQLDKDDPVDVRIAQMSDDIRKLIYKEMPTLIAIEDVNYQRNAQVLIGLARLQGHIMRIAMDVGVPVVIYKPSVWRKVVGIKSGRGVKRQELKDAAMALIKEKYGIDVPEDIAEAICIGECALHELKGYKGD